MQRYFARHALTAKHGGKTARYNRHRKARFHQPEPSAHSRNILASIPLAQRPAIKPCGVMWCKSKPGVLQLLRMVRLCDRLLESMPLSERWCYGGPTGRRPSGGGEQTLGGCYYGPRGGGGGGSRPPKPFRDS